MDFYNADETPDQEDEDKFAAVSAAQCDMYCTCAYTPHRKSLFQGFEPFRENVVFLIDAQPAMSDLADAPVHWTVCAAEQQPPDCCTVLAF